jgi:hypothetical protein
LGKKCCVVESMIKYKGKAVSWVQYMPKKPIRHGLKVFALSCAYMGYLYSFEVGGWVSLLQYTDRDGSFTRTIPTHL